MHAYPHTSGELTQHSEFALFVCVDGANLQLLCAVADVERVATRDNDVEGRFGLEGVEASVALNEVVLVKDDIAAVDTL